MGVLDFAFQADGLELEVHIFTITDFVGEPVETEEMRPQWFSIDAIPYTEMWPDDEYWFPLLLAGKRFKGTFLLDQPSSLDYSAKIVSQELHEVEVL